MTPKHAILHHFREPGEMSSVGQSSPAGAGHVTGHRAAGPRGPLVPRCCRSLGPGGQRHWEHIGKWRGKLRKVLGLVFFLWFSDRCEELFF